MSPMIGESLSVIIQGENSQRVLGFYQGFTHEQSPTIVVEIVVGLASSIQGALKNRTL